MASASRAKRWLRRALLALAHVILLFVIDFATGSFALYGWQVPLLVRVVDASTGAPIEHATVSWGFTFDGADHYEGLGTAATRPTIRMTYCRGGGAISDLFRGLPQPDLSMYRLEFAAPGFLPRRIDGTAGRLVEDASARDRERLSLRLPDVKLERSTP